VPLVLATKFFSFCIPHPPYQITPSSIHLVAASPQIVGGHSQPLLGTHLLLSPPKKYRLQVYDSTRKNQKEMEEKEAIKSKTKGLEGCNFHILPWNQTQLGSTLGGSEMGDPW